MAFCPPPPPPPPPPPLLEADGVVASLVDAANVRKSECECEVAAWTAALLPLVKGKIMLDKMKIARISNALGEVERADQRGSFTREVLKVSKVFIKAWAIPGLAADLVLWALGECAGGHGAEAW